MAHVIQFADYTFPQEALTISTNFGDLVPKTVRLPGVSGGYDEYGTMPAPGENGNISLSFTLVAQDPDDMQALKDAVKYLASLGKKLFQWTPQGETVARFCWARVNSISIPEQPSEHSDLHQPVKMSFQVSSPTWESYAFSNLWYLDGSVDLDGETNLVGLQQYNIVTGDEQTITNDGTADTFPIFRFEVRDAIGVGATAFGLQRLSASGAVLDQFTWGGNLEWDPAYANSNQLVVNCRTYEVIYENNAVGNVNSFQYFDSLRAQFFRLAPGDNIIRVIGTFFPDLPGLARPVRLTVDYRDGWK